MLSWSGSAAYDPNEPCAASEFPHGLNAPPWGVAEAVRVVAGAGMVVACGTPRYAKPLAPDAVGVVTVVGDGTRGATVEVVVVRALRLTVVGADARRELARFRVVRCRLAFRGVVCVAGRGVWRDVVEVEAVGGGLPAVVARTVAAGLCVAGARLVDR